MAPEPPSRVPGPLLFLVEHWQTGGASASGHICHQHSASLVQAPMSQGMLLDSQLNRQLTHRTARTQDFPDFWGLGGLRQSGNYPPRRGNVRVADYREVVRLW